MFAADADFAHALLPVESACFGAKQSERRVAARVDVTMTDCRKYAAVRFMVVSTVAEATMAEQRPKFDKRVRNFL